jgi:hypothetical protein
MSAWPFKRRKPFTASSTPAATHRSIIRPPRHRFTFRFTWRVVALGIAADGQKHALGLWEGATENAAVCQSLLANLQSRGLRTDRSLLVILDGAQASGTSPRILPFPPTYPTSLTSLTCPTCLTSPQFNPKTNR